MRSIQALLVSCILRKTSKKKYSKSEEEVLKEFDEILLKDEEEYEIPQNIKFQSSIIKEDVDKMDVYYLNKERKTNKVIFYIHGGGYVHRPLKYHWKFVDKVAQETDSLVIFPVYPLAPHHHYQELYDRIEKIYIDYCKNNPNDEIIFMGDSAGGGFAIGFYEYCLEKNLKKVNKVIALSPWVDIKTDNPIMREYAKRDAMLVQKTTQIWGQKWVDDNNFENYMVSPTYFKRLSELKNINIFVGTNEILYPDIVKFFKKIKENEGCSINIAKGMNHVFPLYPIPEAKRARKKIVKIIGE